MLFVVYRYTGGFDIVEFVLQTNYTQIAVLLGFPLILQLVAMSALQGTIGMYATDLVIVQHEDGEAAGLTNMLRRPLGVLGFVGTAGFAAFLPYMNDRRRTIGDVLSGTRVIEEPAPGRRIAYDTWRLFKASMRGLMPVSVAGAIALLLLSKQDGPNKTILLDALLLAGTATMMLASLGAALRTKLSRVRLTETGVQRSGWLGWKRRIIEWDDIDFARVQPAKLCPYFEVHRYNHRSFRIPIEHDTAQLAAIALASNGVRIEQ